MKNLALIIIKVFLVIFLLVVSYFLTYETLIYMFLAIIFLITVPGIIGLLTSYFLYASYLFIYHYGGPNQKLIKEKIKSFFVLIFSKFYYVLIVIVIGFMISTRISIKAYGKPYPTTYYNHIIYDFYDEMKKYREENE